MLFFDRGTVLRRPKTAGYLSVGLALVCLSVLCWLSGSPTAHLSLHGPDDAHEAAAADHHCVIGDFLAGCEDLVSVGAPSTVPPAGVYAVLAPLRRLSAPVGAPLDPVAQGPPRAA